MAGSTGEGVRDDPCPCVNNDRVARLEVRDGASRGLEGDCSGVVCPAYKDFDGVSIWGDECGIPLVPRSEIFFNPFPDHFFRRLDDFVLGLGISPSACAAAAYPFSHKFRFMQKRRCGR